MNEQKDHTAMMVYVFVSSIVCGFMAGRILKHTHTYYQNRKKHFKATDNGQ